MALSRLRLRLARGFAVALFVGFVALDGASYWYVTITNGHDFNERLKDAAASFHHAIRRQGSGIAIDTNVFAGVQQAMVDFSPSTVAFVVYDSTGQRIATGGNERMVRLIPPLPSIPDVDDIDRIPLSNGLHLRYTTDTVLGTFVVAGATTDRLRRNQTRFVARMLLMAPLALVLALVIGYLLSRYALAPIDALGRATAAISPGALAGRLPVSSPPDELDRLAGRFNDLLDRIQALQDRSHRFVREVAHQIRTPLTLVLGEADLGLERERSAEEYARALRRVHAAAGQMTHRVQDLLLLARMEAGERPPLRDTVELDALALEATDLFRARARALGQHLQLDDIVPCELTGDAALLREGLLELLENACRHGEPGPPVALGVRADNGNVFLEVRNTGEPIPFESRHAVPRTDDDGRVGGLGLSIMQWIAKVHGGELVITRRERENIVALRLPAHPMAAPAPAVT
ncbi:MAG TPA: HAMP domain-containing sensor histidine kinase [Gemmatimonadales bacterium]|jgi:signal transduction histidine kinase